MFSTVLLAAALSGIIMLGVVMTLFVFWVLSAAILKGIPSSFTLELPPYCRPQIGRVIIHPVFDWILGMDGVLFVYDDGKSVHSVIHGNTEPADGKIDDMAIVKRTVSLEKVFQFFFAVKKNIY